MEKNINNKRVVARVVIEAATPLSISSGSNNVMTDDLILTDINGLPYIPGTTICGVIRHAVDPKNETPVYRQIFGFHGSKDGGLGSRFLISNALLVGEEGQVVEKLQFNLHSDFYTKMRNLPIRQHVRIGDKGATMSTGKFDQQVIYKGARFAFEMELVVSDNHQLDDFNALLSLLQSATFRLGGGSTKGYGEVKVISLKKYTFDLTQPEQLKQYIHKTSSLNDAFWNNIADETLEDGNLEGWDKYELHLKAEDYFIFGSGLASDEYDADSTSVKEDMIVWSNNKPNFINNLTLIPASSVKGAIRHRTEYWYRKATKRFDDKDKVTELNQLFGSAEGSNPAKGKILIGDFIYSENRPDKLFNHVKIDRFTGGAIDGALFSEAVTETAEEAHLTILIDSCIDDKVKEAFEKSLRQICLGQLPLGGATNHGHGIFKGKLFINSQEHQLS